MDENSILRITDVCTGIQYEPSHINPIHICKNKQHSLLLPEHKSISCKQLQCLSEKSYVAAFITPLCII